MKKNIFEKKSEFKCDRILNSKCLYVHLYFFKTLSHKLQTLPRRSAIKLEIYSFAKIIFTNEIIKTRNESSYVSQIYCKS